MVSCNWDISRSDCTLATCCIDQSYFDYRLSLPGNLFYAVLFSVFVLPQLGIGIYYKTWGYLAAMMCGLSLEILGYAARIWLYYSPFADPPFLMYLICLTVGPVFFSAAIYLCLARIMVLYGVKYRIQPRTVAIGFMTSDFTSLVLQSSGGAITDIASTDSTEQTGIDIAIAGLLLQAISLTTFLLIMADFAMTCRKKGPKEIGGLKQQTRERPLFKMFLAGLLLATVLILIRSIFRVDELWGGFTGTLWNDQVDFMVLDGAMISLSVILLTVLHPGFAFAGAWDAADWTIRADKEDKEEVSRNRGGMFEN